MHHFPQIRPSSWKEDVDARNLEKAIKELQALKLDVAPVNSSILNGLIRSVNYYKIYASLGPVGIGATMTDICKRSKLTEQSVVRILEIMRRIGLVTFDGTHFIARQGNMDAFGLKGDEGLKLLAKEISSSFGRTASSIISSSEDSFVFTTFAIAPENLNAFKLKLRDVVFKLIDEYQDDAGSEVRQVLLVNTNQF